MLISSQHKFIFVHMWKTGGTSIKTMLRPYSDDLLLPHHPMPTEIEQRFPEQWRTYFKFGFVRNPYDQLVSLYFFLSQTNRHPVKIDGQSFRTFVLNLPPEFRITQADFLKGIDFYGRFENLKRDFENITTKLGLVIPFTEVRHNTTIRPKDYRRLYDEETKAVVQELFKQDLETFGYTF